MVGVLNVVRSGPAPGRIAGGFARVPVGALARAWRACRSGPLGVGDFRAWLALREMAARRCAVGEGRAPAFGPAELARLLGVSERRAAASARRLERAGLVAWSGSAVAFPGDDGPPDDSLADSIGGGRGDLAVPRRMLRHLARGGRPALIATALGILLRCLSRRREGFDGRGRVKASWIAEAFGVDLRAIKAARKGLTVLGWIAPEPSDQLAENRWGRAYRIDLAWAPPGPSAGAEVGCRRSPPPPAIGCRRSPPPLLDQDPLRDQRRNQEPASGGPAGVEMGEMGKLAGMGRAGPGPRRDGPGGGTPELPPPRLADVRPEDLADVGRVLELHGQAAARGLVGSSEADRLKFAAAAEHALAVGTVNAPGLLIHLVRGKLWRYLTQEDEDRAQAKLKRHLFGPARGPERAAGRPGGGGPRAVGLSADGLLAREIRAALGRSGCRVDPLPALRAKDPSWTRERWLRAVAELGGGGIPAGWSGSSAGGGMAREVGQVVPAHGAALRQAGGVVGGEVDPAGDPAEAGLVGGHGEAGEVAGGQVQGRVAGVVEGEVGAEGRLEDDLGGAAEGAVAGGVGGEGGGGPGRGPGRVGLGCGIAVEAGLADGGDGPPAVVSVLGIPAGDGGVEGGEEAGLGLEAEVATEGGIAGDLVPVARGGGGIGGGVGPEAGQGGLVGGPGGAVGGAEGLDLGQLGGILGAVEGGRARRASAAWRPRAIP